MFESFRAFGQELIDYAGMFPPAELPLDEAIRNYFQIARSPDAWMLGRFLCPAERLDELWRLLTPLRADTPEIRVSVVVRAETNPPALLDKIVTSLDAAVRFQDRLQRPRCVEAIEIRLPMPSSETTADVWPWILREAEDAITVSGLELDAYYEAPLSGEWRTAISGGIEAIGALGRGRAFGRSAGSQSLGPGLKLRCGGQTPASFPEPEQIAFVLSCCRRAAVPFKATAGLHHAIRSFREEAAARMHGFLNVFGAALLAHEHALDEAAIRAILEEENTSAFRFTPEALAWRDLSVGTARIRELRTLVTSFGSCSFDEPRHDLQVLGLLAGR